MSARPTIQLDYAPRPVWFRRVSLRRWIGLAVLLIVLGLGVHWGPDVWGHFRLLHYQRQCASWQRPPDALAYQQFVAGSAPREWLEFRSVACPGGVPGNLVFLHLMKHPAGEERIVAVEVPVTPRHPCNQEIDWYIFRPGSLFARPTLIASGTRLAAWYATRRPDPASLRLWAGQIDPGDPSHFSLRWAYVGDRGVLEGWLLPNDRVKIEIQSDNQDSPVP